ncbi:MAG: hypothetical protein K0B15_00945 [Lentimicrobium sp.]|nr:hypothetical protein [Lentimicrobium sp.]
MDLFSLKWQDPERKNYLSSRLSFVHQLLIARKFNDYLSLQVEPTYIHKNLVAGKTDDDDTYALGLGGRYKLTQRVSMNVEYFYVMPGSVSELFINPLSVVLILKPVVMFFSSTSPTPTYFRAWIY